MSLILRLASSMDRRPDLPIASVKISLINNDITFKLIPKKIRDDLLLEKWNLKSCEELLRELKGLNLIIIRFFDQFFLINIYFCLYEKIKY